MIIQILRLPSRIARLLSQSIEGWFEMAPYNLAMMSMSLSGNSIVGLLRPKDGKFPDRISNERRKELLAWHFLAMDRMRYGRFHRYTALKWLSLGDCLIETTGPHAALHPYETAIKIFRRTEDQSQFYLDGQEKLAICHHLLGNYAKAAKLLEEALSSYQQNHHQDNQGTAETFKLRILQRTALAYEALERPTELSQCLLQILSSYESTGLPTNNAASEVARKLSLAFELSGNDSDAALFASLSKGLEWLTIMERACGIDSIVLVSELETLQTAYRRRMLHHIESEIARRINMIKLIRKVELEGDRAKERDLNLLAELYESRDRGGDRTVAFHLRKRIERQKTKI